MSQTASQDRFNVPANRIGYCFRCGYDLRGQIVQRCPECGFNYDPAALHAIRLDWCSFTLDNMASARTATLLVMAAAPLSLSIGPVLSWFGVVLLAVGFALAPITLSVVLGGLDILDDGGGKRVLLASLVLFLDCAGRFVLTVVAIAAPLAMGSPFLALVTLTAVITCAAYLRLDYHRGEKLNRTVGMPKTITAELRRAAGLLVFVAGLAAIELLAIGAAYY